MNRISVQSGGTVIDETWEDNIPNYHITLTFNGRPMFSKVMDHRLNSDELTIMKDDLVKKIINRR